MIGIQKNSLVCAVLFVCSIAILLYGYYKLQDSAFHIAIPDYLNEQQRVQIAHILRAMKTQSQKIELDKLQQEISQLAWVDHARIRRGIGNHILDITFFSPQARLNDTWFLSSSGKRKDIQDESGYTNLVDFSFDFEQQKTQLPKTFRVLQQLQSLGFVVSSLHISAVGNWSVIMTSGLEMHFGLNDIEEKIARLQRVLPKIQHRGNPRRIDLRNLRGVAVVYQQTQSKDSEQVLQDKK